MTVTAGVGPHINRTAYKKSTTHRRCGHAAIAVIPPVPPSPPHPPPPTGRARLSQGSLKCYRGFQVLLNWMLFSATGGPVGWVNIWQRTDVVTVLLGVPE